jgi:UDP-glucose 4-epimerase
MEKPGISGKVFNVACERQIAVNELLAALQGIAGKKISPRHEPPRSGEVRHSLSSTRLARAALGYEVKVGLEDGLAATWEWFRKRGASA